MLLILGYLIVLFLAVILLLVIWCLIKEKQIKSDLIVQKVFSLEKTVQDLSSNQGSFGLTGLIAFDEITEALYRLNNEIAELKQSASYTIYLCELQKINFIKSCISVLVFFTAILFIMLILCLNHVTI